MTKQQIRKIMKEKRDKMSKELRKEQTTRILKQIQNDQHYQHSNVIAIFFPMGSEIDLRALLDDDKTFVFPRVEKDGMHFYVREDNTKFIRSKFGIMEPVGTQNVDQSIDYMLVPALAISKQKYRIGYGKGYYDQFLNKHRPEYVMGVIYDFQELENVPEDVFDEPCDGYFKG